MNRANVMLTRRCNMTCPGCGVIKHFYPELTTAQWKKTFTILKKLGIKFVQIYGGEPTIRNDLSDIIRHCNNIALPYTVVTNSKRLLWENDYYDKFISAEPISITCSIGMHSLGNELIFKLLNERRFHGEITATIMITAKTIYKVRAWVSYLSRMRIGAILFFLHIGNETWNYRGPVENEAEYILTQTQVDELAKWLLHNYNSLYIRNSRRYIEAWGKYAIKQDWKCSGLTSLQVNCDGKLSVCQDKAPLDYSVFDLASKQETIIAACNEQARNCPGCFYDCYFEHDNLSRLEVRSIWQK